ncbi:sensor domain-containing protein [Mongoliimonas terrestris]|uniref:sensor domain-containing protein n=1 Tax=Mongoliimonas terrestris TaxID=1709001 RepID=UPI0015881318|nr:PAS domain-containing protein [Mongoliimonas terrestris]
MVLTPDLRRLVAASGDCLLLLDPDGAVLDGGLEPAGASADDAPAGSGPAGSGLAGSGPSGSGPAGAPIGGCPFGSLTPGTVWADLFAEADRPAASAAVRLAAAGGVGRTSGVAVMPDGSRRHWQSTLVLSGDGSGRILALSRDGTATATAAAALIKRVRLHEALIQATSEVVWHLDVARGVSHRRGWAAFTGEALADEDHHGWIAFVHPDDRAGALAAIEAAVAARRPYITEYRLQHASGGYHAVEDHAVPLVGPDGTVTDWVGIVTDVQERKSAEEDLRRSEERLRLAVEATSLGIWDVDLVTGARQWSAELKAMLGLSPDVVPTEAVLLAAVHPDDRAAVAEHNVTTFLRDSGAPGALFRVVRQDTGAVRWIHSQGRATRGPDGRLLRRTGTFEDVTDQHETRQALKQALRRYEALITATSEIVWHANAAQSEGGGKGWDAFTGQSDASANGDGWLQSVHPDDRERARQTCRAAMAAGTPYTNEYRLWHVSGTWRWVVDRVVPLVGDDGRITEWVGIIADVEDRKSADAAIWKAAHTDDLTGLANRALFQKTLDQVVDDAAGRPVGLILIDLDRFKEVNDSLGHDAGDRVLKTVAARLTAVAPPEATIARLGGDEFGVILPGAGMAAAEAVAETVLTALKAALVLDGREIDCAATVGYTAEATGATGASALLKQADIALYAAKSAGRGQAFRFEPAMREELDRRVRVLGAAKAALARGAIRAYYQPKMRLSDGGIVGFEALLRWTDAAGGLKTPAALMEAFADPDLATRLGERMLATVIADMKAWSAAGLPFGHVALNVAGPEFQRPGYAGGVLRRLQAAGLPPTVLEIEVTESVLIGTGTDAVSEALRVLDAAGVTIALDDFGTGYASLTHLKKHPVSVLKIDRSFVSNLEGDADSAAIVQAVLGMAENIGIKVVAEGVETAWQRDFLAAHRCDLAQGYLIAKPMPPSRVPHFLSAWRPATMADPHARQTRRAGGG